MAIEKEAECPIHGNTWTFKGGGCVKCARESYVANLAPGAHNNKWLTCNCHDHLFSTLKELLMHKREQSPCDGLYEPKSAAGSTLSPDIKTAPIRRSHVFKPLQ